MARDLEEITSRIELEGFSYAVLYYYGRDVNSDDETLNELWEKAYDSLKILEEYLEHAN